MPDEKRRPGPKPETFKVPLPLEEALQAALKTKPPGRDAPKKKRKRTKP